MDNTRTTTIPLHSILQRVALAVAGSGKNIFHELIRGAAESLNTDYAFIGENVPEKPDHVNILAFYSNGQFVEPFIYDLALTPCRSVVNQTFRIYPQSVQSIFNDERLKSIDADGYAAIPLYDSSGKGIGLMGVMHRQPLTDAVLIESVLRILSVRAAAELERRYALQAKEHSDISYRSLFESTEDAVFVHDIDTGVILDANQTACERYGYTRDEILCLGIDDLSSGESPYTKRHALQYMAQARAGESPVVEWHARNKDGSLRWEEAHIKRRIIGGVDRILLFSRDITERKLAEAERIRYEAQLRQSQKMEAIGQLTGGIAHDFNNILTGVMGYIVMAVERNAILKDGQLEKYLHRVQRAVERARDLIQQMLTFSRGQRGSRRNIELAPLVRESIKLLESSLPATIEIATRIEPQLPLVNLDPVHMEQVLMNLCINARDAMQGHGKLVIAINQHHCNHCICTSCRKSFVGEYLVLSVMDSGSGIPENILDRIFEPFFSTKEIGKGSGMGLAMAHGIVHEYGGHIMVEKNIPQGTCFNIILPIAASTTAIGTDEHTQPPIENSVTLHGNILLVDDDATVREFMEDRLASWGLSVDSFSSSKQAITHFYTHSQQFDIALLDQSMPQITGIELARQLLVLRPDMPILLYTGYIDAELEEQMHSTSIHALLKKPIAESELLHHLRAILS